MQVDVIIPVYKPTEKLNQLLQALVGQTCKVNRIFLMHTEDEYDLSWAREVCQGVSMTETLVKRQQYDHGATRDAGIQESDAEVVVLMNQDAVPQNERLLEYLVEALFQEPTIAVAYARQSAAQITNEIEKYTRAFNYPKKSMVKGEADKSKLGIKTYFCSNVCAAYKKEIYQQLGGFEKKIIFNEDMVYAARAIKQGFKIAYAANAVVWHGHDWTTLQLFKRNFDLGVSQACYPEIFEEVKSENEGVRLVRETTKYFIKRGKLLAIMEMVWKNGWKYVGYKLGKAYKRLPMCLVRCFTMNLTYWEGENSSED